MHLESNGIEYLQFSFRWMNNLLMREIPLRATIRLWDTYLVGSCKVVLFMNLYEQLRIFRVSPMVSRNSIVMYARHSYVHGQGSCKQNVTSR